MGIVFKLLCPGDVPAKAHKMILNETTSVVYEQICVEKHHVEAIYDMWYHDYRGYTFIDNTTNKVIEHPTKMIWGLTDRIPQDYEVALRELLMKHCEIRHKLPMKSWYSRGYYFITRDG